MKRLSVMLSDEEEELIEAWRKALGPLNPSISAVVRLALGRLGRPTTETVRAIFGSAWEMEERDSGS